MIAPLLHCCDSHGQEGSLPKCLKFFINGGKNRGNVYLSIFTRNFSIKDAIEEDWISWYTCGQMYCIIYHQRKCTNVTIILPWMLLVKYDTIFILILSIILQIPHSRLHTGPCVLSSKKPEAGSAVSVQFTHKVPEGSAPFSRSDLWCYTLKYSAVDSDGSLVYISRHCFASVPQAADLDDHLLGAERVIWRFYAYII